MNRLFKFSLILAILVPGFALAQDWKFKPMIYSRGGITLDSGFTREATNRDNFNLGGWGNESQAIFNSLTEITLEATKGKDVKFVYGIDSDSSKRFFDDTTVSLNERLAYLEYYRNDDTSFWFGQRAYRGDGDYLSRSFPFDEHNMLGLGVRFANVGPVNIEFAYGIRKNDARLPDADNGDNTTEGDRVINLLINKIEYPLANGKIKTNLELHKVNDNNPDEKSTAYMAGIQFQRWGDKVLGGDLYNLALINYSHGYIYTGNMQSAFNTKLGSKLVLKWGGDWKTKMYGVYWNLKYQDHKGNDAAEKWSYVDVRLRPVYVLTKNVTTGLDYEQRIVTKEAPATLWSGNAQKQEGRRLALMLAYNLENQAFNQPVISIFAGRICKEKATTFFPDKTEKKANFVRINYEISI